MEIKCSTAISTLLIISIAFTIGKCASPYATYVYRTAPSTVTTRHGDLPILTVCNISLGKISYIEGYCVPIRNCVALQVTLTPAELRAKVCSPGNANKKNPYICCDKYYVISEEMLNSSTQTQTAPSTPQLPQSVQTEEIETTTEYKNPFKMCGYQNINNRIFGGNPAAKKEFPWLGRLLRRDKQGEMVFSCTGALITSRVVLTTAHCLASDALLQVGELHAVSFGEHETECSPDADECLIDRKTVIVSSSVPHPNYNRFTRNHDNDIGLIILRDEVKFSRSIAPICLLEETFEPSQYYVAGWGKTETGSASGVKLKVPLPPFSWIQCAKKYNTTNVQLTSHQICAGGIEGADSCQGDSGGPLMVERNMKWYAAGVVSFGVGCGRKGWPAIYVYVPRYITWIKDSIRERVP